MPLWRDPLDELIENLERGLPEPSSPAGLRQPPPLWKLHAAIHAILHGSAEEKKRTQPYVDEWVAYYGWREKR